MGIRTEKWAIAFRKKKGSMLDDTKGFTMLRHDCRGFYADPFLFEHDGKTYLFAEYLRFRTNRGSFAYAVYDPEKGTFSKFREIIREDYHLSYPLIFEKDGEIYMMPEAYQSDSLYVYKAKRFPDEWEKAHVLIDHIKLVDTTPFMYNDQLYAVTKENSAKNGPMMLLRIDTDNWRIADKAVVTDDMSISRPGGYVIEHDGKRYMVTQDCEKDYGMALNFLEFSIENDMDLHYKLIKKVTADQVSVNGGLPLTRIHTYNFTDDLEVIDFKYPVVAFYRAFWQGIRRLGLQKK